MDASKPRVDAAEAALGAYRPQTREMLVPLLLYKSVFLGEWFEAMVRHERDEPTRHALLEMSRSTLRQAIELLASTRRWDEAPLPAEQMDEFTTLLQRRILYDLLALKEGSNEAVVLAAMRAPTRALRDALMRLADLDRAHADQLRTLLGISGLRETLDLEPPPENDRPLGAHERRISGATLGKSIHDKIERLRQRGDHPTRLVLSHVALRHLRDEGAIAEDATAWGLQVDIDFGWEGECFSIATDDRVRLTEILSIRDAPRAGEDVHDEMTRGGSKDVRK